MCCIRKLRPNYSCEIYVTLELFLDQMHLIGYHNIQRCGICLASYSLPKVKGFLFRFDVYRSHILLQCFTYCLGFTTSKIIWWMFCNLCQNVLKYLNGRDKPFPMRENGIHPSMLSSNIISTPKSSTLLHKQLQHYLAAKPYMNTMHQVLLCEAILMSPL